ncbi:MAG: trypsin-like peptidase domain-containing protein [Saprospiraceae bacterium]|nr:trypsin-like peptidase domain-containing protein [Saprospiraceae bacterium]
MTKTFHLPRFIQRYSLFFLLLFLFQSCATILNSPHQKVRLRSAMEADSIYIDGVAAETTRNGKYKLKRDLKPKHIVVKQDGYIDEHKTVFQHHKSPLTFLLAPLPWASVPMGFVSTAAGLITFGASAAVIPLSILGIDNNKRSYNYKKDIYITDYRTKKPVTQTNYRRLNFNNIKWLKDPDNRNISITRYPDYKDYKRDVHRRKNMSGLEEYMRPVSIDWKAELNNCLSQYIPKDSLEGLPELSIEDSIQVNAYFHYYELIYVDGAISHNSNKTGMLRLSAYIHWEFVDAYGSIIDTIATSTYSGEYPDEERSYLSQSSYELAIDDLLNRAFIQCLESEKLQNSLNGISPTEEILEHQQEAISMNQSSTQYVSTIDQAVASSVTISVKNGHGSGFFISDQGHIITNYHVISEIDSTGSIKIVLNDGSKHTARIIRQSKKKDLALLQIEEGMPEGVYPFKLNPNKDELRLTTDVYAIGSPSSEYLSQSISKGIISGFRKIESNTYIQTDASVNPGNSGGPLTTEDGLVIAIISAKISGIGIEGIAFGIPAEEVIKYLNLEIQ